MLLSIALVVVAVVGGVVSYLLLRRLSPNLLPGSEGANSKTLMYTDGPYIAYTDDRMTVYQVRIHDGKPTVIRNTIAFAERTSLTLACQTDTPKPVSFRFQLQERMSVPPPEYDAPERLLAVSDIEGNFYALHHLLLGNRVIDRNFNWIFGRGHLVILGDVFDRETDVVPCLWLIYKLEQEAMVHGGRVHFILGNHEEMNLRGDERFLAPKYQHLADELGIRYSELFSNYTELGQWLRTKNTVEKIGDTLFVHAGISFLVENSGLTQREINRMVRRHIGTEDPTEPEGQLLLGNDGPLWYRGYFSEGITTRHLQKVLQTYEAERMVVGHTVVPEITALYDGRLYAIDVRQPTATQPGTGQCLWMERGKFFVSNEKGLRRNVTRPKALSPR